MVKCILVLEDNDDRRRVMREWLDERLSMYKLLLTDDPAECVHHIRERGRDILVASLDHDLHERPDESTTLTGMQVVDYLVEVPPAFPVLLHTSNRTDGERMRFRLKKARWDVTWVTPFDDTTWVGADWYPALKRAIRTTAEIEALTADDPD